ncbi:uncharacterized protein LAESUDRAFT_765389 [Laetiporus sulphureus 93-53]|uniref:SUN domain-containing protein n=1 Tax=Laetiporus sulphureus 93-53 TaxID=1314785 RepID=A0A165ASE7_9APHY|nr:uncharacterized protein LAESUDRAFT_765389 [Laetiporus sulphureus 93-53]KZS99573.1 hypothetical protein LAESUDRAFT_765389 [Laetiporus sulphureus 93-53]
MEVFRGDIRRNLSPEWVELSGCSRRNSSSPPAANESAHVNLTRVHNIQVVDSLTSETYRIPERLDVGLFQWILGLKVARPNPAAVVLRNALRFGECWPMDGPSGHLGLQLVQAMHIAKIIVRHVPLEMAEDIRTAPRMAILWGLSEEITVLPTEHPSRATHISTLPARLSLANGTQMLPLAFINYDIHSSSYTQTFDTDVRYQHKTFKLVVLEILDNWGVEDLTCLYRIHLVGWM